MIKVANFETFYNMRDEMREVAKKYGYKIKDAGAHINCDNENITIAFEPE